MFLSRDIGASSVRGPGDDFWYSSPVTTSIGGARVSSDTAMRLSTVYKCVRVRSETIGMLPLMIYRRSGESRTDAADHPLYSLLHDRPNPWQTSMQWRQLMQMHIDLRGNAYSQIVYDGAGRVDMLVPLNPDTMTVEVLDSGMPRYRYRDSKRRDTVLVAGEVLHVALMTADGYVGVNPIELQREAIGAAITARDYGQRYFANSARPPTWIEMPGKFASADDRREWVNQWSREYGATNSGKTPVLERGLKLHAIAVSNEDAQYLESRKAGDIDIAGIYRVPPHKIGLLDRATWGNIEHQQIDFVSDCIMPSCVAWEQALRRDLDFGDDAFPEFKLQALLRGDTPTRYRAYGLAIKDGWLTRNEARRLENLNPIDGLDEPLEPLNMAPAGSRSESADDDDDDDDADVRAHRHELMERAAAERVARRELAMWRKGGAVSADHARWIAEVLAVPERAAAARVESLPGIFAGAPAGMSDAEFVGARAAELLCLGV
jgi:HK97 family phage portal protein